MTGDWYAHIYNDVMGDPLMGRPRLLLVRKLPWNGEMQYVTETVLVVKTAKEGEALEPHGIFLLPEMLEPIRLAIEKMNGLPEKSPEAENRVLREWLKREQEIVNNHALRSSRTAR